MKSAHYIMSSFSQSLFVNFITDNKSHLMTLSTLSRSKPNSLIKSSAETFTSWAAPGDRGEKKKQGERLFCTWSQLLVESDSKTKHNVNKTFNFTSSCQHLNSLLMLVPCTCRDVASRLHAHSCLQLPMYVICKCDICSNKNHQSRSL